VNTLAGRAHYHVTAEVGHAAVTPAGARGVQVGTVFAGEPVAVYVERRGGRVDNTARRRCLCNALLAAAGFRSADPTGTPSRRLSPSGRTSPGRGTCWPRVADGDTYTAEQAVAYLLGRWSERFGSVDDGAGEFGEPAVVGAGGAA
jgi:hypothetical protein